MARLMNYLLAHHAELTWSIVFGLIAASIWVVGKQVKWSPGTGFSFLVGAAGAFVVVNLMPATTPEDLWFVFVSGMLAICAMILPGLSGAFILLILGKYEFIIATLENPFLAKNLLIIGVFAAGCAIGLAGFARFLKLLLQKYHYPTLAFLTGLMLGSMRKIWPWKKPGNRSDSRKTAGLERAKCLAGCTGWGSWGRPVPGGGWFLGECWCWSGCQTLKS
ncbi:MAG: DUF368 domain-containing protein [Desulfobacterales bacterium]